MIKKKFFGNTSKGEEVYIYTLKNENGMKVKISEFGGAIVKLITPDRYGRFTDVVCGYDCLWDYENAEGYQGALVGRTAGRIGYGRFTLEGKEYQLSRNTGEHTLHGGNEGFSHKVWSSTPIDGAEPSLVLEYTSVDGEEGYPGTLKVRVTYTLTADNALSIHYEAVTDKTTIVNLTNHSYFNLAGFASGDIHSHKLRLDADTYVSSDEDLIPSKIVDVEGTPFDFRVEKEIGRDIDADDIDLKNGGGYDLCMNFVGGETAAPVHRATLSEERTGREMQVYTNYPCTIVYTGNVLGGDIRFKDGYPQIPRHAVCLEAQKMPDAINHSDFTDVVLRVGDKYDYTTVYKFTTRK